MFGVGRDLWGSSSTTPLPKQGHLQQAAQDLAQAGLEYLQGGRLSRNCRSSCSFRNMNTSFTIWILKKLNPLAKWLEIATA